MLVKQIAIDNKSRLYDFHFRNCIQLAKYPTTELIANDRKTREIFRYIFAWDEDKKLKTVTIKNDKKLSLYRFELDTTILECGTEQMGIELFKKINESEVKC